MPEDLFSDEAEAVVNEYARSLADWAELSMFPRSMRAVAEKLKHRVRPAPLPAGTRGLMIHAPISTMLTAETESPAAQQRTIAHEIFHPLIGISHNQYRTTRRMLTPLQARVEELCEMGAAELHVPRDEVRRLVDGSPKICHVPKLSEYFDASLAATLSAIVAAAPMDLAGVVFEYRNKPSDMFISNTAQGALFGIPEDYDPPKRLRIQSWSVSQALRLRFNIHKHIEESTSIYRAFECLSQTNGVDDLTSIGLSPGRYRTESWAHKYQSTIRVLTLIWFGPVATIDDAAQSTGPEVVNP